MSKQTPYIAKGDLKSPWDKLLEEKGRNQNRVIEFCDDEPLEVTFKKKESDEVNPEHYKSQTNDLNIDCIDAMRAAYGDSVVKNFCIVNSFKYLFRSANKGQNTDIMKAQWYLDKFLNLGGYEENRTK